MTRHLLCAGVFLQAAALWVVIAPASAASDTQPVGGVGRAVVDLFHSNERRRPQEHGPVVLRQPRHRLYLELDGARAQAEDWLHTAGLSLFEHRDSEGRRSYQVMSGSLADDWPTVRLHARVGGPQLSVGLQPKREVPALGFTIPGNSYTLEVEGIRDRRLGTTLMGRVRWSAAQQRIQWGIALPVTLRGSIGALLQVRITWGK